MTRKLIPRIVIDYEYSSGERTSFLIFTLKPLVIPGFFKSEAQQIAANTRGRGNHNSNSAQILTLVMAIPKTAPADPKWMEIAPRQRVYLGKRRPFRKTLLPIAEERSLSNSELMDGLRSAFPAICGFKDEGDNGRFAS